MIFQDPYASLNPRWKVEDIVGEPLKEHGDKLPITPTKQPTQPAPAPAPRRPEAQPG